MLAELRETIRKSAMNGVLAPLAAVRDYYGRPSMRASWGGPLNGQCFRRLLVSGLVAELDVHAIIETGTFRGTTTEWLAELGPEVWTVEASPRFYWYSRLRLRDKVNVHLRHEDSRSMLRSLCRDAHVLARPTLFYLDAHWGPDLPLAEELTIIAAHWTNWVAVIDDFAVPGDDGYAYDDYGGGSALRAEYLEENGPEGLKLFYPTLSSRFETGKRRGCAVVTSVPSVMKTLRSLPELVRP